MKRFLLAALAALALPTAAAAQVAIIPSPVPTLTNGCTLIYNSGSGLFTCESPSAASQPLTDAFGLMADDANSTKVLAFQLSGISSATTRTWTIPDANITVPSTIASLAANTFTALQTMNGGFSGTTGALSSTLSVGGATTLAAMTATTGSFSSTLSLTAGQRFQLDGAAGNTWIYEFNNLVIDAYVNGESSLRLYAPTSGGISYIATDFALATSGKKFYLDGGGDTYWYEAAANNPALVVGGSIRFSIASTYTYSVGVDHILDATKKLYLDGGGNTYIAETSPDVMRFYTAGLDALIIDETGNIIMNSAKKLYIDGGVNTYIFEAAADVPVFVAGGVEYLRGHNSGWVSIGGFGSPTMALDVRKAMPSNTIAQFVNSSGTSPFGIYVQLSGADPNNATQYMFRTDSSGGMKSAIYTNGGLHNYSANNVNLSDSRTKFLNGPVETMRDKFSRIKLYRGRYKDSTVDRDDVMWTAQEIAAIDPNWTDIFQHAEPERPEVRDEDGNIVQEYRAARPELMGTRDNQIFMANVAVTIEHDILLTQLQKKVAALELELTKLKAATIR